SLRTTSGKSEAKSNNAGFALRKRVENLVDGVPKHALCGELLKVVRLILDEVAEHAFLIVADRLFEGDRHANRALDLLNLLRAHLHRLGDLFELRITTETLRQAHHLAVV